MPVIGNPQVGVLPFQCTMKPGRGDSYDRQWFRYGWHCLPECIGAATEVRRPQPLAYDCSGDESATAVPLEKSLPLT